MQTLRIGLLEAGLDRLIANNACGAVFAHQCLDALMRFAASTGKIRADVAAARDQRCAIGLALGVGTSKPGRNIDGA